MTDDKKWQAILKNDKNYDGLFFYGVKSTKIFCRPSCKSKIPLKTNVLYFKKPEDAKRAGYRPCKRCHPELLEYQPIKEIAERIKLLLDRHYSQQKVLTARIMRVGVSYRRMIHIFKAYYGITPKKYYDTLRLEEAGKKLITTTDTIIDIAYSVGFQSLSAFYSFFQKNMNASPSKYRKENKHGVHS